MRFRQRGKCRLSVMNRPPPGVRSGSRSAHRRTRHNSAGNEWRVYAKRRREARFSPPNSPAASPRGAQFWFRIQDFTIFPAAVRLQEWMDGALSTLLMIEQDRRISEVIAEQRFRLRSFIRKRVPNESDVEDLLQEVFCELVEAHRLLMPIDYVTGWLFRVARNRITDFFRKKRPETFTDAALTDEDGELLQIEDMLPSPDAGPEALYLRNLLLDELESALGELPAEQREVFIAHELEGHSFKEMSAESGISVNTLLSRKRYAVLHLRRRLLNIHNEFVRK